MDKHLRKVVEKFNNRERHITNRKIEMRRGGGEVTWLFERPWKGKLPKVIIS